MYIYDAYYDVNFIRLLIILTILGYSSMKTKLSTKRKNLKIISLTRKIYLPKSRNKTLEKHAWNMFAVIYCQVLIFVFTE